MRHSGRMEVYEGLNRMAGTQSDLWSPEPSFFRYLVLSLNKLNASLILKKQPELGLRKKRTKSSYIWCSNMTLNHLGLPTESRVRWWKCAVLNVSATRNENPADHWQGPIWGSLNNNVKRFGLCKKSLLVSVNLKESGQNVLTGQVRQCNVFYSWLSLQLCANMWMF